jgi:hypothetical protein
MAFLRFIVIAAVLLTALYAVSWISLRRRRRRLLLEEWKETRKGPVTETRMREWLYDQTRRFDRMRTRQLFVLVYLLPLCTVATIIYLTNFH